MDRLVGDASKAAERLGWRPTVDARRLAQIMVDSDVDALAHEGRPWIDKVELEGWA